MFIYKSSGLDTYGVYSTVQYIIYFTRLHEVIQLSSVALGALVS